MLKRGTVMDKTMRTEFLKNVLDDQVGNMTQNHFKTDGPHRAVRAFLEKFARKAAHLAINGNVEKPDLKKDWKQDFDNVSEQTMQKNGLEALLEETLMGIYSKFPKVVVKSGMNRYALYTIANCAGQVARMIKVGLDPKYISLNRREIAQQKAKLLRLLERSGTPTMVFEVPVDVTLN